MNKLIGTEWIQTLFIKFKMTVLFTVTKKE
jgi:hypothetical protein